MGDTTAAEWLKSSTKSGYEAEAAQADNQNKKTIANEQDELKNKPEND